MLPTRTIPVYGDDHPSDWFTFLYKAAKGSIQAPDIVSDASLAHQVAITNDPTAPTTMPLDEYDRFIHQCFPLRCPAHSIQSFHDLALSHGWMEKPFRVSETPRNDPSNYVGLWGRNPVNHTALMNDAMLHCLECWSADHFLACVDHYQTDYDSRTVTAAMLYLSITWPNP